MAQPTTPVDQTIDASARKPARRGVLDLVSGGPHASLCRMVKRSAAVSLVEIGVGDGTRAPAVLSTLLKTQPELKYIAIDQFELGQGPIKLKDFHRQIRSIGITPNLIPMPYQQGLTRVAHTFGAVDLILIADQQVDTCDPILQRITKPTSLILKWDGQSWHQIEIKKSQENGVQQAA